MTLIAALIILSPMQSHSEALGIRTSTYEFWEDVIRPITGILRWKKWEEMIFELILRF